MFDNVSWPSPMFGWVAAPPDAAVVGDRWQEMWRTRIESADFWFKQWAGHQTRDEYWSATAVRDHYADVGVPVFIMSGWQDGYKNPVEHVISGLTALGKPVAGLMGAWGHKYPFKGYPGPRVDWLNYVLALVGPLAQRQDTAGRKRMAAMAGLARLLERAQPIALRGRERQVGGRGRRVAIAGEREGALSRVRPSPRG
jgi:hypothetical protein